MPPHFLVVSSVKKPHVLISCFLKHGGEGHPHLYMTDLKIRAILKLNGARNSKARDGGFCGFELLAEVAVPWPSDGHSVNSLSGEGKRVSTDHCNNFTI